MRRPTPNDVAWAWYRATMAGRAPPIHHEAQCGYFKRRLVRGGPWVPARIWLEATVDDDGELTAPERLRCQVDGREQDPEEAWLWLADHPIEESEYRFMVAQTIWVKNHAPTEPEAAPQRPMDINKLTLPF